MTNKEIVSDLENTESTEQKKEKKESLSSVESTIDSLGIKMDLHDLKELVEDGIVEQKLLDDIVKDGTVDAKEMDTVIHSVDVQKVLESLDHIETSPDIDHILPKSYRVSSNEYKEALLDANKIPQVLTKIDQSFDYLYMQHTALDKSPIRKFALFTGLLHKNLEHVQADTIHDLYIDVKNTLLS